MGSRSQADDGNRTRKRVREGNEEEEEESPRKATKSDDRERNDNKENDNPSGEHINPRRLNVEGRQPEVGVIQKIAVENFMCHRKFKVDLCRNVNFIHGQNGRFYWLSFR